MANFAKPKVYTGVSAALSVKKSDGALSRVAYATGFTLDLSSDSEDFNVLGQRYQESVPTYNSWTASADAKASFENEGQKALLWAYQNQEFIYCEFIINDGYDASGNFNSNAVVAATGYASIESLSIDAGDNVTGFSVSLKGTGNLGFKLPDYVKVTAVNVNSDDAGYDESTSTLTLRKGNSCQLYATVTPEDATNNSVSFSVSGDKGYVTVDEESGWVLAIKETSTPVKIVATSNDDETVKKEISVVVTKANA